MNGQGRRVWSTAVVVAVVVVVLVLAIGVNGRTDDTPAGLRSFCRWWPALCR